MFARPTEGYLDKVKEARGLRFVPGIYMCPKLLSLGHFVAFESSDSKESTVITPPIRFVAGQAE